MGFGRFRVIEELGSGGFATVYRAHDPNFDQDVALKVLAARWSADYRARERFVSEARVMRQGARGRLTLAIHDIVDDGDQPFLVMEYCERGTLEGRLADQASPLDHDRARELITAIGAAVGELHRTGVIHRDLKPSNFLIRIGNEPVGGAISPADPGSRLFRPDEELVVSDYGLAKVVDADATGLTFAGGTPGYGAPEQFVGDPRIGPPADVYAASALIVASIGRKPRPGVGDTFDEAAWAMTGPFRPTLERGLALRPAERPADIGEWCDALLDATPQPDPGPAKGFTPTAQPLAGTPTRPEPGPPAPSGRGPADDHRLSRHRLIAVGVALVLVVLAAVLIVPTLGSNPTTEDGATAPTGDDDPATDPGGPTTEVPPDQVGAALPPETVAVPDSREDWGPVSVVDAGPTGTTTEIEIGETVAGTVGQGDVAAIDFWVYPGQQLFFDAWPDGGACGSRGDADLVWRLPTLDGTSDRFDEYVWRGGGSSTCRTTDQGPLTFPEGGRYRLLVFYLGECGPCSGSYELAVRDVPPPDVFAINPDVVVSAATLGLGAGRIETPGAVDRYVVDVEAGQELWIETFVEDDCAAAAPGLVLTIPSVADGDEVHLWDDTIAAPSGQCSAGAGPITVDTTGQLELWFAYPTGSAATGNYSFEVVTAGGS